MALERFADGTPVPQMITWKGRRIEALSREELIEALREQGDLLRSTEQARNDAQAIARLVRDRIARVAQELGDAPSAEITLALDDEQAMALAQLCKRFTWEHAKSLANAHDGGQERDLMIDAVGSLQRSLAERGYAPR